MNQENIEEFIEFVKQFNKQVNLFNRLLIDTYNLECEPTYNEAGNFFPRNGELITDIGTYNYRYHGGGCTFTVNGIIVSYDIDVLNNNEIKLSSWKFNEFIRTFSKEKSPIDIDDIDNYFFHLVELEILIQRTEGVLVFNIRKGD